MVSTLDTLPAVSLWDVLPVDWLPVVSFLDTLPACEPVPCFVTCFCGCCAVVLFRAHVLFMCVPWSLSVGGMVCLWWSIPSVLPVDGEPVGCAACACWLVAVVSTLDTLPACEPVPWSVPSTHCQR